MHVRGVAWIFLIVVASILFGACAGPGTKPLRIITTRPELALVADAYQLEHPEVRIDIHVQSDVSSLFRTGRIDADLLIGENLLNLAVLNHLQPLDKLTDILDTKDFYAAASTLGTSGGKLRLAVLGFDLPMVVSSVPRSAGDFQETVLIGLENLRDRSLVGRSNGSGPLANLGFSTIRDPSFLEVVAAYQKVNFASTEAGNPQWNQEALGRSIGFLRDWVLKSSGDATRERQFLDKYDYMLPPVQLAYGRVKYLYSPASEGLPAFRYATNQAWVLWPSVSGYVQVLPRLLCAAIPESTTDGDRASDFIAYLCSTQVQQKFIAEKAAENNPSFGFLGYFSTNRYVQERIIPQYWPLLVQSIPPESVLRFPTSTPLEWIDYERSVLFPYLLAQLEVKEPDLAILTKRTQQWLLQKGLQP